MDDAAGRAKPRQPATSGRFRKVAIAHSHLGRGGSEVYVMWGIDALVKAGYDVELLTMEQFNLDELNEWCGTSLSNHDFEVRRPAHISAMKPMLRAAAVRDSAFQRFCRSVADQFEVLISGYNPCDFGRPAIHLVQDFSWHETLRGEFDQLSAEGSSRIHRKGSLRTAYLRLARLLGDPSGRNVLGGQDLFIANSLWVSEISRSRCGISHQKVVYPPVVFRSDPTSHAVRDDGFVMLGRIGPEKRIEQAIEIMEKVRALGHEVRLHIIGDMDVGTRYANMLRTLVSERSSWVIAEGPKVGLEKEVAMMRHRYAIHARQGEAFGIGVAELVKAGCIPFVHTLGGAAEIVEADQLCWSNTDDAVRAINRVLQDPVQQSQLRTHLQSRGALFGIERFRREFLLAVEQFVDDH